MTEAGATSAKRPLLAYVLLRTGNPLDWSAVDRCLLSAGLSLPFIVWCTIGEYYFLFVLPGGVPYVDRGMLRVAFGITVAFLATKLAIIAAGLRLRRTSPGNEILGYVNSLAFFVPLAILSYLVGHYTTPFGGVAGLGAAVVTSLLLGQRVALVGVSAFLAIVVGTTIAEQAGLVPYAPLYSQDPFESGRLSGVFLLVFGAPILAIMLLCVGAIYLLLDLWRDREKKLAQVHARLETSHADLARAYADLRGARRRLARSEKLATLGRLTASVASEINNPVSLIASNLDPLRARLDRLSGAVPGPARDALREATEYVDIMGRGAARTARILADLRSFSRSDRTAACLTDLHEALEVTLRLLEHRWRGRIVIHRELGTLPPVECDEGRIGQVFMNLLANACDAIEKSGNIWIQTRVLRDEVAITIEDDGEGIPAEEMERVFEPFFTTKEVGRGTGLGLSVVHGIVSEHGGRVEVASRPGGGATFRVVLPVRPSAGSDRPGSADHRLRERGVEG